MARVKRGVTTQSSSQTDPGAGEGLLRPPQEHDPDRQAGRREGRPICLSRPQGEEAQLPRAWIQRINAAVRQEGLTYGQFMHGLKLAGVDLDRKVLADIAMHEGEAFKGIIAQAQGGASGRRPGDRLSS